MLTWGVKPILSEELQSTDAMISAALKVTRGTGLVSPGDKVVIVGSAPSAPPGHADFLRVVTLS